MPTEDDMLVLSRKKGEKIVINENITIEVVEIKNKQIRLGFEANKDIPIRRAEVPARTEQAPAQIIPNAA